MKGPATFAGPSYFPAPAGNGFGDQTNRVWGVRALINYDPNLVALQAFARGSWLSGTYTVTQPRPGKVRIRVDGDSSAGGSGIIVWLRFRKVSSGSTRVDFESASALNHSSENILTATHGGTLAVQEGPRVADAIRNPPSAVRNEAPLPGRSGAEWQEEDGAALRT